MTVKNGKKAGEPGTEFEKKKNKTVQPQGKPETAQAAVLSSRGVQSRESMRTPQAPAIPLGKTEKKQQERSVKGKGEKRKHIYA